MILEVNVAFRSFYRDLFLNDPNWHITFFFEISSLLKRKLTCIKSKSYGSLKNPKYCLGFSNVNFRKMSFNRVASNKSYLKPSYRDPQHGSLSCAIYPIIHWKKYKTITPSADRVPFCIMPPYWNSLTVKHDLPMINLQWMTFWINLQWNQQRCWSKTFRQNPDHILKNVHAHSPFHNFSNRFGNSV